MGILHLQETNLIFTIVFIKYTYEKLVVQQKKLSVSFSKKCNDLF